MVSKALLPKRRALFMVALGAASLLGCGRTMVYFPGPTPPVPACHLEVVPAAVSFGAVPAGASATETIQVTDTGDGSCALEGLGITDGGSSGFTIPDSQTTTLTLQPGDSTELTVEFNPASDAPPGPASGTLAFASNDPKSPEVGVPLTATVPIGCELSVAPSAVDFGVVPLSTIVSQTVTVTATGAVACNLAAVALAPGSDPFFALANPSLPLPTSLATGQSFSVSVTFDSKSIDAPHTRTGAVAFTTTAQQSVAASLKAETPVGCKIVALPNPLTFGNVGLNQSITEQLTVTNQGMLPCTVSDFALAPGTDPLFTLAPTSSATTLTPGQSLSVSVTFDAAVSLPPYLHTGTLTFDSSDPDNAMVQIPLSGYVSTACALASQWIYTVDSAGDFEQFDPTTLTFTPIGPLGCPDSTGPFSMAVDQNAVAWVEFEDGNLFQVSTTTAACSPSGFQRDQQNVDNFGMGFVFDPTTGGDTLYVAGGPSYPNTFSTLATIAFPSLLLTTVAPLSFGFPELSGTGDGQLWGFAAGPEAASGTPTLAQIDPATGNVLQSFTYPSLGQTDTNFAMKFWGGSFWIFLGTSVYQVPRDTGVLTTAFDGTAPAVVGAGVSTCAPVQ